MVIKLVYDKDKDKNEEIDYLDNWKMYRCLNTKIDGNICITPDGEVSVSNCEICRYYNSACVSE